MNDNGGNTGNNVGSYQSDAIRNITGEMNGTYQLVPVGVCYANGAFDVTNGGGHHHSGYQSTSGAIFSFDASRVVPVGSDNRPKNVYVTYIIKY